jgi:multiple sugar transport system permease protein
MRIAARGLRLVLLAAFAVFFAAPVLWLILAPTKSDGALVTSGPFSFGSFHQLALAWDHLDAFSDHIYRTWIGNSLLYAFSATAIVLATAIPAGYGLALGNFPGRRVVLTLTLVVMIMPASALVLPIFLELNSLHLIGSVFSVILPFSFFPFGVYLAYIYYATAVPRDLLDAARVDGAGEWQTFRRVALPLAKPIVALVFFFSFVADWNNFFLPYAVLADSSQYPRPRQGDGVRRVRLLPSRQVVPAAGRGGDRPDAAGPVPAQRPRLVRLQPDAGVHPDGVVAPRPRPGRPAAAGGTARSGRV